MAGGSRPASSQPAAAAASGNADGHQDEGEQRDPAEIVEVVEVGRCQREVGAGDAEERAEEGERAGGGGGQRAADPARRAGRGQGAQVAGALAADQPDGHGEDREREQGAGGGRDGDRRRGAALSLRLDRQAGIGGEVARLGDLLARQGPARLDQPAGRGLFPAAAAKTVERDERVGRKAGSRARRAEELPAVDPLDVRDRIFGTFGRPSAVDVSGMTSSSVRTAASARKSVLGSTAAGSIPRYPSTAGVAT